MSNEPPVINTIVDGQTMQVTEWARRQAAENLKHDPAKRKQIVEMLGEEEARRRYPEAWDGEATT